MECSSTMTKTGTTPSRHPIGYLRKQILIMAQKGNNPFKFLALIAAIAVVLFHLAKSRSTLFHSSTSTKDEARNRKDVLRNITNPICRRALQSLLKGTV
jgi:hypothetical protein